MLGLKDSQQQQQPVPSGMTATDFKCLTCGGPILENTTSTTSCVKCARLRTRRRNFAHPAHNWSGSTASTASSASSASVTAAAQHYFSSVESSHSGAAVVGHVRGGHGPHDSRDSGVSSGSSQDYGECTPPVEKALAFPR